MVKTNNIDMWYETFGNSKDPAMLLMMGNSSDATLWPEDFCKGLARRGLYVIRFDQRDTGLSTWFNFKEKPYTLLDMAEDCVGLLDVLNISKAHIVGYSTGGMIAQLLTIHHPCRVSSLILLSTSMDLTIKNDAFAGKDMSKAILPPPEKWFVDAVLAVNANKAKDTHEKIVQLVENFSLAHGKQAPFDRDYFYKLFEQSLKRIEGRVAVNAQIGHESNHALATSATRPVSLQELANIAVPTCIIAGEQDPIFPVAHAKALASAIPHAHLLIIKNFGHIISPFFFEEIIKAIAEFIKSND